MTYTKEQKKTMRVVLKSVGYNLSIKTTRSCFSGNAFEHLSIVTPDGRKISFSECTVFARAQYDEHKKAFTVLNKLLEDFKKQSA